MTMPIDLVLVRHGQSEGNAAKRRSEAGDDSAFTDAFRKRHSASFHLTEFGREQARIAGAWLRQEFPHEWPFDRYAVSEYFRALETAGLLGLLQAEWFTDYYLTERDWGDLDVLPQNEREGNFGDAMRRREVEPFFWRPPNGESFLELCLRIDRVLDTLHRYVVIRKLLSVAHGEVIRAFQIRIERISQALFRELVFSDNPDDRIYNREIIHYSRRNPKTRRLAPHINWVRRIRPTETPLWSVDWRTIGRRAYSNSDLLDIASRPQTMVK